MFKLTQFITSLGYAWRGLRHAWSEEQNFRIQVIVGFLVIVLGWGLDLSALRMVVLLLLVTLVLVLELLNTFFEKLVDLLSPRVHNYVKMLKDLLAATVLVASMGATIVGILIFWPYLSRFF